ncbi:MAG TPA: DUF262 domain-containing protein [Chloroflexia bacterium]|jgi:hypothetical protein
MKPSTLSIFELFERERRYLVPLFQRPYVWSQESQWEPLWEDITAKADELWRHSEAEDDRLRNHFMGAVVLNQIKVFGKQIAATEIIDGQQRLTTLQVVLVALRDYAKKNGHNEFDKTLERITENSLGRGDERYKVWPTNADRVAFETIFSAGSPDVVNAKYPLQRRKRSKYYLPRPRLVEAYLFFYKVIEEYMIIDDREAEALLIAKEVIPDQGTLLNALMDAITRHLVLVLIDLEDNDDPQIIFETLNAYGVPLLPSDLIRNYVFLEATRRRDDVDSLYQKYWQEYDEGDAGFWKVEERQGRLTRPRLDLFLYQFLTYQTERDIIIKHLFQEFRGWWASRSHIASVELQFLKEHAAVFKGLLAPDLTTRSSLFARRLRALDTATIYPLLLFLLAEKHGAIPGPELDAILTDLESYLVRRAVCGLTTQNYNRVFLSLLRNLRKAPLVDRDAVRQLLLEGEGDSVRWPSDDEFRNAWLNTPVYQTTRGRVTMILEAIDLQLTTSKQEVVHIAGPLSIEHVMPQQWSSTDWPFPAQQEQTGLSQEELLARRSQLLHTFGNLTLLTQPLNSAISNGPFYAKRPKIAEQSNLRLNAYFQQLKDTDQWTEEDILRRGRALFEVACKIWPRP